MAVISAAQRTEWTRLTDGLTGEYQGYDVTVELLDRTIGNNPFPPPFSEVPLDMI